MSALAGQARLRTPALELAPNLTPPPGNPRFPLFDSLRAIAALCVFLGHTITGTYRFPQHPTVFLYSVQLADQGVAVFFLISGFLLYRPFVASRTGGPPLSLTGFLRRRLLRIVPAYWVALTVAVVIGLAPGLGVHNFWIFYGFGQIYSVRTIGQGIGVAWTLCVEMTFYAALPLLSLLAGRIRGPRGIGRELLLLAALSAAALAYRAHFSTFADFATVDTLPGMFCWFAAGMALAVLSVASPTRDRAPAAVRALAARPGVCWAAAVVLFVALHEVSLHVRGVSAALGTHLLYGAVAVCVLLPGVWSDPADRGVGRVLRSRRLTWVGLVSYAFYLYHTLVIRELNRAIGTGSASLARWPLVLVAGFAISAALAAASYYGVERPLMRRGRRRDAAGASRPAGELA